MPYKSQAQEGWAHSPAGTKALGGPAKVAEWDAATKGKKLPARKGHKAAAKPSFKMAEIGRRGK
jgi:hypothetical protein